MAISGVAVQQAQTQIALAQQGIKQQASAQQQLANVVDQGAKDASAAASHSGRGQHVNFLA